MTAKIDPSWITTSKTLASFEENSIKCPNRIKCPVLEMGKNSVSPSTMPRKNALRR
jgi:hypothetical protein